MSGQPGPDTLVLTQPEVRRLLPMRACMDLLAEAFRSLGRGEGINPLRSAIRLPGERGVLGLMPGMSGSPEALGLKVVTVFPGNHGTSYDAHQGLVVLFDTEFGLPTAILDASEVTSIRTAAASGVATELLAREDSMDLAIIGSGVQARTHLEAMIEARPIQRVRVYSPTEANRNAFADMESARQGVPVEPVDSAEEASRSKFYRGQGCSKCDRTGAAGRRGIYEVLSITESIREGILKQLTTLELLAIAKEDGFSTMQDMGRALMLQGEISAEEYRRVLLAG